MVAHFCKSSTKWGVIIEAIETALSPMKKCELIAHPIGNGDNAWQVAEELYSFLGDYIGDTLFDRRLQMIGGRVEDNNGFEFWRQLFFENEGTGEEIVQEGRKNFQSYPKCSQLKELSRHLDGWKQLLDEYASELYVNPRHLFDTVMELIPEDIRDKIEEDHDDIADFQSVIAFSKKKANRLRTKGLAVLKRKTTKVSVARTPGQ